MKKILFCIVAAAFAAFAVVSCSPSGDGPVGKEFNKSFLYAGSGEWSFTADYGDGSNELRHKFNSDGTGWEKNITLEQLEEQKFTWSLTGDRLTFIHNIETGGAAPEDCTVTTLSETRLVYKTENGTTITCTKLP